jgi:predicted 3-demethylubiquinone-9 3-methyltransferase (glyoxalase superfamily)
MPVQKIRAFLWFNDQAQAAANFYVSIFKDSEVLKTMPGPGGTVSGVDLQLEGQQLIAFNGGPHLELNEAFSLFVTCETQEEVDRYWALLTADGGKESRCGWLKDKFGVSWQIIPTALPRLMGDKDPARSGRVMQAMLGMQKIEIAELEKAYEGR